MKNSLPALISSVASFSLLIPTAKADLTINFQFDAGGTTTRYLLPSDANTDIPVQVWAAVTGSGTLGVGDALFFAQSQQIGSGAFITGGVTSAAFSPIAPFNNGAATGTAADYTDPPDGIADIGNPLGVHHSALARATIAPAGLFGPAYYTTQGGWATISGGQSIQLGTFSVHVGSLTSNGTTKFNVLFPPQKSAGIWFEDAQSLDGKSGAKAKNTNGGIYSTGTSISFITMDNPPTVTPPADPPLSPLNPIAPTPNDTFLLMDFSPSTALSIPDLKTFLHTVNPAIDPTIIADGDTDPLNLFDAILSLPQYAIYNTHRAHTLFFEYTNIPDALTDGRDMLTALAASGNLVTHYNIITTDPVTHFLAFDPALTLEVPEPATAALLLASVPLLLRRRKPPL